MKAVPPLPCNLSEGGEKGKVFVRFVPQEIIVYVSRAFLFSFASVPCFRHIGKIIPRTYLPLTISRNIWRTGSS